MTPGLSRKFRKPWSGPFKISTKISDLNYEIVDQNGKKQTVHVNRLKLSHNTEIWKPKTEHKFAKKRPKKPVTRPVEEEEEEEEEIRARPLPVKKANRPEDSTDHEILPNSNLSTPEPLPQITDTPASERSDPSYQPSETPRSRREMQNTRFESPMTRAHTKVLS
jgi:hypothetical protein